MNISSQRWPNSTLALAEGEVAVAAISARQPAVIVEYDARGKRAVKRFADPYAARRFYAAKLRDGKRPAVRNV